MEITVQEKETCVKDVVITVTKEEVEKEYASLYDEYKNDIVIPGFRKGKFPRKLFERKYSDTIADDVRSRIKENYLKDALEEKKFKPLVAPHIDEKEFKRDEAFEFTATVEVAPEVEVPDLAKIKLEKDDIDVEDTMVEEELGQLQNRMRSYKAKKKGSIVKDGDKISCSYEISVDGEVIDAEENADMFAEERGSFLGDVKNYPKTVLGKKEGGTVTLKTVLPPYFHKKEYQGKEASVKVTIKKCEQKVLPDPESEEFLSAYGCTSFDELKDRIRERIKGGIEKEQNAKFTQDIYTYFDENTDIELPPTVLKREIETRRNRLRHQLSRQDLDDNELKTKLAEAEENIEKDAVRALKNYFILEKIAEENTIVVTEEEIDRRIAGLAASQRVTPADMKEHLSRIDGIASLRSDIQEEKAIQFIIEKADVTSKKGGKKAKLKGKSGKKPSAAKKEKKEKK